MIFNILELSDDILFYLLTFLNNTQLKNLALVNKFCFELTKENKNIEIKNNKNYNLINHCNKIINFTDVSIDCKYYIRNYAKLFKNNLKIVKISSCICLTSRNEIVQLINSNKHITHLTLNINFYLLEADYYKSITELKKLEYLKIIDSNISDMQLKKHLESIKTLKSLHLIHFPNLFLFNLFLPNLNEISIIRCNNIDYEFLSSFIKIHPKIINMDLSNMPIDIHTSLTIARHAKQLRFLNLSYSDNIVNDLDLALICSHCRNLIYLDLSCTFITNKSMYNLAVGCLNLKTLIIPYTGVGNDGIRFLLKYIKTIIFLDLRHTLITKELITDFKNYKHLNYKVDSKLIKEKID